MSACMSAIYSCCVCVCSACVVCHVQVNGQLQQATWSDALQAVAAATANLGPNEFKAIAGERPRGGGEGGSSAAKVHPNSQHPASKRNIEQVIKQVMSGGHCECEGPCPHDVMCHFERHLEAPS